jgi:hypothetical protein
VSVEEVFRAVQQALEAAHIPYMVTGSFASSASVSPGPGKDIDIGKIAGGPTALELSSRRVSARGVIGLSNRTGLPKTKN